MDSSLLDCSENSSALNDVLGTGAGPIDVCGVPLIEDGDLVAVDIQEGAVVLHFAYENPLDQSK